MDETKIPIHHNKQMFQLVYQSKKSLLFSPVVGIKEQIIAKIKLITYNFFLFKSIIL